MAMLVTRSYRFHMFVSFGEFALSCLPYVRKRELLDILIILLCAKVLRLRGLKSAVLNSLSPAA